MVSMSHTGNTTQDTRIMPTITHEHAELTTISSIIKTKRTVAQRRHPQQTYSSLPTDFKTIVPASTALRRP